MKISILLVFFSWLLGTPSLLFAQDTPEAIYQKWVEASRAGNIQALLAVSSAQKAKEFHQEYSRPEQQEEIRRFMKLMAPISYKLTKTVPSKDGNKASLFMDAIARDFFSLNDPSAKPQKENVEVRMVKENGQWKVDKQCMGKDGCGVDPDWISASYGKTLNLGSGATLKIAKGKPSNFKGIPVSGEAMAVDLIFTLADSSQGISYFLHRSPNFAEFYVESGGEKITPIARIEDFPIMLTDGKREPELKILEENFSYSKSSTFTGEGTVSLLFDMPKGSKDRTLYLTVGYGEGKHSYSVK